MFETSARRESSGLEHEVAEAHRGAGVVTALIVLYVGFKFLLNKKINCWDGIHNHRLIHDSLYYNTLWLQWQELQ